MSATEPRLDGVTGWPEELAARYRERGWWAGVTLGELVDRWAEEHGDRIAVGDDTETVTYRELAERSRRLAGHLRALGIARDDRVVVQLPNVVAFCDLTLALLRIGALPVMALPAHREHEIGYMIEHSGAVALAVPETQGRFDLRAMALELRESHASLRHVLVAGDPGDADGAVDLRELARTEPPAVDPGPAPEPGDVALFLLSGGTTGLPKLIPRTHDDYAYNARASAELCGLDRDTVYLAALPVSHNFPLGCPGIFGTWHAGGRVVLTGNPSPPAVFDVIAKEGVTVTALVPALALRWIESPDRERFDLSSLKVVQVGGARLAPEAGWKIEPVLGARLQQAFGMAEGLLNFTRLDDPDAAVVETQGRPMCPDDEIRIVGPDGEEVAPGEDGELLTRGPYTLRGYYRAPEHNARAFTDDGFYRSGDVVRQDADGNLLVQGRVKDLINRGGEKVSAEEIENLVLGMPEVFEVAAVAMPDRELGERTCVYVVPHAGRTVTLEQVCAHLTARQIARFKLPERLEVVDVLPVTKVGKIDKKALRDDVRGRLEREGVDLSWAT